MKTETKAEMTEQFKKHTRMQDAKIAKLLSINDSLLEEKEYAESEGKRLSEVATHWQKESEKLKVINDSLLKETENLKKEIDELVLSRENLMYKNDSLLNALDELYLMARYINPDLVDALSEDGKISFRNAVSAAKEVIQKTENE